MNRRDALVGIGIGALGLAGAHTRVWRFTGSVRKGPTSSWQVIPDSYLGPVVRVHTGQRVRIRVRNNRPEPSIVHWHGLDVPKAADGHPHRAIGTGAPVRLRVRGETPPRHRLVRARAARDRQVHAGRGARGHRVDGAFERPRLPPASVASGPPAVWPGADGRSARQQRASLDDQRAFCRICCTADCCASIDSVPNLRAPASVR